MAIYRIQNTLQDIDGLSKDRYVNTFYVASPTPLDTPDTMLLAVNNAVRDVYTGLSFSMGGSVGGGGHTVKAYDMSLPPGGRLPLQEVTYALTSTGKDLPTEVAMCVTLECSPVAGVAPQSTRGRVYVGPLSSTADVESAGLNSRPAANFMTTLLGSFSGLITAIAAIQPSLRLVVASTTQGKAKLAPGNRKAYEVVGVSVDDAWDTQRSRGIAPTHRDRTTVNAGTGFTYAW